MDGQIWDFRVVFAFVLEIYRIVLGKNNFSLIHEKWTVFSTFFCTFLVFSKAGKIEMKIFGLQYDDLQEDLSDDAQSLLWEF